eukprot:COSAG05_NODE_23896_length_255_cov_0.647436_1_plen_48_part_01
MPAEEMFKKWDHEKQLRDKLSRERKGQLTQRPPAAAATDRRLDRVQTM